MGDNVIFVRPVETVGVVLDILQASTHSNFAVVDKNDKDVLYGTIGRNALCILLQQREFGKPKLLSTNGSASTNYLEVDADKEIFLPLIQWAQIEKAYPKYPSVKDLCITDEERESFVDLRPYANTAPVTVNESSSVEVRLNLDRTSRVPPLPTLILTSSHHSGFALPGSVFQRTYQLFRSLGLRFLPVVNRYNQIVGTITRSDLTPEALAESMLSKGKRHC
jgi:chloride channel 7